MNTTSLTLQAVEDGLRAGVRSVRTLVEEDARGLAARLFETDPEAKSLGHVGQVHALLTSLLCATRSVPLAADPPAAAAIAAPAPTITTSAAPAVAAPPARKALSAAERHRRLTRQALIAEHGGIYPDLEADVEILTRDPAACFGTSTPSTGTAAAPPTARATAAAPAGAVGLRGCLAIAPSALAALQAAPHGERRPRTPMRVEDGVAIVAINGVIGDASLPGADVSVGEIRHDLQSALANPDVRGIVLAIDSPGGSIAGVDDLAEELRQARGTKPIVAHSEGQMGSAAYWIATGAERIVASRSASVGGIGVVAALIDDSRRLQNLGFDPKVVKSAPGKGSMQANGSFGDAEKAELHRHVSALHEVFVQAIAEGRGIALEQAQQLADGRMHLGQAAHALGLVDEVGTFAAALAAAGGGRSGSRRTAASRDRGARAHGDDLTVFGDRAAWQREFARSAELQEEFGGDVELYVGWRQNEANRAIAAAAGAPSAPADVVAQLAGDGDAADASTGAVDDDAELARLLAKNDHARRIARQRGT